MQKGFGVIYILLGILIIAVVAGGAYYFGKSTSSKKADSVTITQTSGSDLCETDKNTILGIVTNFENLQQKHDAKGVLQLFTKPKSQSEIDDYNHLSGEDMHIQPRLYGNVSTIIKVLSYKVIKQAAKNDNNSCSLVVEEERSYYGGPTNPQYLPPTKEDLNLILSKQNNIWLIDQYQSQNPQVKNGKYSGWLMEYSSSDETAGWKKFTSDSYNPFYTDDQLKAEIERLKPLGINSNDESFQKIRFSIMLPPDWVQGFVDGRNPHDGQGGGFLFSNGKYQINVNTGSAGGGNACFFPDDPTIQNKPKQEKTPEFGYYQDFREIQSFVKMRRVKLSSQSSPVFTNYTLCSNEGGSINSYGQISSIGGITYYAANTTPDTGLATMDKIISTIKKLQ